MNKTVKFANEHTQHDKCLMIIFDALAGQVQQPLKTGKISSATVHPMIRCYKISWCVGSAWKG